MKKHTKKGLGFGLTSGVITTLGLIVGINIITQSRLAVIGSIITIAIADAVSDGFGIHIVEETNIKNSKRNIWLASFYTFLAKFIIAGSFIIPVTLFTLQQAITISIIWGYFLIIILSYYIANQRKESALKLISSHIAITSAVLLLVYYIGKIIPHYLV